MHSYWIHLHKEMKEVHRVQNSAKKNMESMYYYHVMAIHCAMYSFIYNCFVFNHQIYRPIAGSLTEARGHKASMHVCREMLELVQIINSEGCPQSKEHPELKVILFGELFNVGSDSLYSK